MFKQFRDGWKAPKIIKAINAANAALAADRIDIAEGLLVQAYNLLLDTTLPQMAHADMITAWRLLSLTLEERGRNDLTDKCTTMANLLQARFDVGDFYHQHV